jgi:hypothetical protein
MPLGPQLRAILDTFQSNGLLPLVRGDAAETRARYRQLALSRSLQYLPEPATSKRTIRSATRWPTRSARGWSRSEPATCAGRCSRYCSTPPTASPVDIAGPAAVLARYRL